MRQAAGQLMGTMAEWNLLDLPFRSPRPHAMAGVHTPGPLNMVRHLSFLH
jgi:hypothetical protein